MARGKGYSELHLKELMEVVLPALEVTLVSFVFIDANCCGLEFGCLSLSLVSENASDSTRAYSQKVAV